MPSFRPPASLFLPCLILLILYVRPSRAFGAGNIASTAKIEGQNWRHGDIEDTLLTLLMTSASGGKKFSKMDVKRVYFGNWLRDYSQAVDVGTVKYVSAEAIRIMLWVLGFMSFGYGTREFEVTHDRLGCYRPEEHIDNPKDYADNIDARQYDRRLRGPVDEQRELSVDPRNGLKNYIASEDLGITTSAGLVRNLFRHSIQLARRYNRSGNKADLHEALRLLGTGCHCLEDYSAHSNYTELALIELGERNIFPHVGRQALSQIQGVPYPAYPIVTGTFGGVDFLHSVMGEISDKATQSEVQQLEGTVANAQSQQQNSSMLKDLLNQMPSDLLGGKDQAGKADELQTNATAAQMQNQHITPLEPEEWTRSLQQISQQIYPILEFHDEIMQSITETIEQIPVLPDLIEQVQEQINIFVFSLLAPFVLPIISQVKTELATGSSEIIQSSRDKQLIVFHDDYCTDPTHSMLSKDHFSNVLNEPAGRIASQVLKWVVPQLVECWDDENVDAERTIHRIINGVFHHPALREYGDDGARDGRQLMFGVVQRWWQEKSERGRQDLREKLSREGVENGHNHKPGVHDSGHGCGKPLGMPTMGTAKSSGAPGAAGILGAVLSSASGPQKGGRGGGGFDPVGKAASEAVGGGVLGGLVGGLVGGAGGSLLGGAFGGEEEKKFKKEKKHKDGSQEQSYTEYGHSGDRYGQAEYSRTDYPGGGQREQYSRYEQQGGGQGYGYQQSTETSYQGGGFQRREGRRVERGDEYAEHQRTEGYGGAAGGYYQTEQRHQGRRKDDSEDDDDDNDDYEKKARKAAKKREKEEKKRREREQEERGYGGGGYGGGYGGGGYEGGRRNDSDDDKKKYRKKKDDDSDDEKRYKRRGSRERKGSRERRRSGERHGGGHRRRGSSGSGTFDSNYEGRETVGYSNEYSRGCGEEQTRYEERPSYTGGGEYQEKYRESRRESDSAYDPDLAYGELPGRPGGGGYEDFGERKYEGGDLGYGQGEGYGQERRYGERGYRDGGW